MDRHDVQAVQGKHCLDEIRQIDTEEKPRKSLGLVVGDLAKKKIKDPQEYDEQDDEDPAKDDIDEDDEPKKTRKK